MFVSCLPVIALALGTALAHLLREPGEDLPKRPRGRREVAGSVPEETAEDRSSVPESGPVDVPQDVPEDMPQGISAAPRGTPRNSP